MHFPLPELGAGVGLGVELGDAVGSGVAVGADDVLELG